MVNFNTNQNYNSFFYSPFVAQFSTLIWDKNEFGIQATWDKNEFAVFTTITMPQAVCKNDCFFLNSC